MATSTFLQLSAARTALRGAADPRRELDRLRRRLRQGDYSSIIHLLHGLRRNGNHVLRGQYPSSFASLRSSVYLDPITPTGEVRWAATTLAIHAERLAQFPSLRARFEQTILRGSYRAALDILDEVDSAFGLSLYSIENRLAVLQTLNGVSAQKELMTALLAQRQRQDVVDAIVYYTSVRNQPSTALRRFTNLFTNPDAAPSPIRAYLTFHVTGYVENSDDAVARILSQEEASSVLDYYDTFVSLAQHAAAHQNSALTSTFTRECRALMDLIPDHRLRNVAASADSNLFHGALKRRDLTADNHALLATPPPWPPSDELYSSACSAHAYAVALATSGAPLPELEPGLWADTARHVYELLTSSTDANAAVNALYRIKLNYRSTATAKWVDLNAPFEFAASPVPDLLSLRLAALESDFFEPQLAHGVAPTTWYATELAKLYGGQPAAAFGRRLAGEADESDGLPEEARALAAQTRAASLGDWETALRESEVVRGSSIVRYEGIGRRMAVHALLYLGRADEAVTMAAELAVSVPRFQTMTSLPELRDALRQTALRERLAATLAPAILLDLHYRDTDSTLDAERDYAYEESLEAYHVSKPSQLRGLDISAGQSALVYYLRNLCVPNVMEGSFAFNSSREVARERYDVCKWLKEIDPQNAEGYEAECLEISRREVIRSGIQQASESKISVDLPALRRWAEKDIREKFNRYKELVSVPASAPDTTQTIHELVEQILQQTLLTVPKDERSFLLASMVTALFDEASRNSEYGLDGYLSIRIRHGTLSGQLRGFLEGQHLITQRQAGSVRYQPNTYWEGNLPQFDSKQLAGLNEVLEEFSASYDRLIESFKNDQLQIHSKEKPGGLFRITPEMGTIQVLRRLIRDTTTFDEFFNVCFTLFWDSVEQSLTAVRSYIDGVLTSRIVELFSRLDNEAHKIAGSTNIFEFDWAVRNARTRAQVELAIVRSWFQLPKPVDEPFLALSELIDIAMEMVKLHHAEFLPTVNSRIEDVNGLTFSLTRFTDILYAAFENITEHSELAAPAIDVYATISDDLLSIEIESDISQAADVHAIEERLHPIREDIRANRYQQSVSREGGTGLKKIRRMIGSSDLPPNYLDFGVTPNRRFVLSIKLPLLRLTLFAPAAPSSTNA